MFFVVVYFPEKYLLSHDAGYRLTTESYGNGLTRNIGFANLDNLRTSDVTGVMSSNTENLDLSYTYNEDKQVTTETTATGDALANTSFAANYDAGAWVSIN